MARRVADVAQMLNAMASPRNPARPAAFDGQLDSGLRALRVGFVRHFHETDAPADSEVIAALQQAADVMRAEGATVSDVTLPKLEEFSHPQHVIMTSEGFAVHAPWLRERPGDYTEMVRRRLLTGAFFTATEYIQAQRSRAEVTARVAEVMQDVDVLLVANLAEPSQRIDGQVSMSRTKDQQAWSRRLDQQYRAPFSMTRQPSVAVMTGLSAGGLPLSMQLVGRYGEDATALRAAAGYERATEWHRLRPAGIAA
jgi:aspartyl-tRNA(Asn)/glutamyl-tRNA(Gln) amidotransferase subunit A